MKHAARLRFLAALAVSLACPLSCSSDPTAPEPVVRIGQTIMGGEDDATDTNVVAIVMTSQMGMCTGSLIAPNLVLTARHCVSSTTEQINCNTSTFGAPTAAKNLLVTTSQDAFQGFSNMKKVAEVFVPTESDKVCGYDVAMIRLAENMGAEVPPLTPRVDLQVEAGEEYKAVGYGNTNDTSGAGSRRSRSGLFVSCSGTGCSGFYLDQEREWEGDTGICSGDSGGPALDTKNRVIGVVSRGATGCTMPIYGNVYAWGDWIKQIAADAAKAGGYEPAPWVTGGSTEPQPKPDGGPETGAPEAGPQPGGPGTACKLAEECASNLCVYENDVTYYCSEWCSADTDCPANWTCNKANGACYQHGGFGETCTAPADCRSSICVSDDGKAWYCSMPCSDQEPCPKDTVCSATASGGTACYHPAPPATDSSGSSGGCSTSTRPRANEHAWILLVAASAVAAARRRRGHRA